MRSFASIPLCAVQKLPATKVGHSTIVLLPTYLQRVFLLQVLTVNDDVAGTPALRSIVVVARH